MRPQGNGLIEMVDERSSERGFYCGDLVGFITNDKQFNGSWEYWHTRFREAAAKRCAYAALCPRYARTMENHSETSIQLSIWKQ